LCFVRTFELEPSPAEGQSLQQKIEKLKDIGHFLVQKLAQNFDACACPSKNAAKHVASGGKKGMMSF